MHSRIPLRPVVLVGAFAGALFSMPFSLALDLQRDSPTHEAMVTENRRDAEITDAIRAELAAENSLSPEAKKVKITTANGSIFLKGTVATTSEKFRIEKIAKKVAKTERVDNDLEVRGP